MTSSTPEGTSGEDGPVRLRAGIVGRAHGLDGSFYVLEPAGGLLELGTEVQVAGAARRVERRSGTDAKPLLRVAGIIDRSGAEALGGSELLVDRALARALEADEWWAGDLQGCRVLDGDRPVGTVRRLLGLPSCEVLEVERDGGGELLVPLVGDAVRTVDVERGRIDVDLKFLGDDVGSSGGS